MRLNLQDLYEANPKLFLAAAVIVAVGLAVLLGTGASASSHHRGHTSAAVTRHPRLTHTTASTSAVTRPSPSYRPSYATNVPSTSVDAQIATEMQQSGADDATLERVQPAAAAWTGAYPPISSQVTSDDQRYAMAFVSELLDRDYAQQSRSALAGWVTAESAREMLPGVPADVGDHVLYAELMDPAALPGGSVNLVPNAAGWDTLARTHTVQHVEDLFADEDENWAAAVSRGFTSQDPLLDVVDVTGVIFTDTGTRRTVRHFSTEVDVGSALHHPGYGVWGIGSWELS